MTSKARGDSNAHPFEAIGTDVTTGAAACQLNLLGPRLIRNLGLDDLIAVSIVGYPGL